MFHAAVPQTRGVDPPAHVQNLTTFVRSTVGVVGPAGMHTRAASAGAAAQQAVNAPVCCSSASVILLSVWDAALQLMEL